MNLWIVIGGVAVLLVVAAVLITRALTKARVEAVYKTEQARLGSDLAHLTREKEEVAQQLSDLRASIPDQVKEAVEKAEKAKDALMASLQEKFDQTIATVKAEMSSETAKLLQERQKEFSASSGEALGQIVNPLKEKLQDLQKAVDANSEANKLTKETIGLDVTRLLKFTGEMKQSADSLAAAFKYGSKLQGDWGETILEELLSSQGLTRGIHFDVQPTLEGSTLRPDVILHLDTRREVIIDAKTSLSDYVSYVNAENDEDKARFLKAHIRSIKSHVKELSAKDYSSYIQPPKVSAGYVIMFVPNMGALWAALNAEPDLWRRASEQNVYIADEQSLYGAIRMVQLTWTQVQQEENHEKVFALAGEIADRVDKFLTSYEEIGRSLDHAKDAFDAGRKKLDPKGQSILNSTGKLLKLGASTKGKALPKALQDAENPMEITN